MKHTLEYFGVRLLDLFFGLLGPRLSMPVACALGTLLYWTEASNCAEQSKASFRRHFD
ncbi:MAG: hypothetical protein O2857_16695 [Planctomycetota bacterium]|nr:hypothetical protein [Planctomycetota bacterium]